MPLSDPERAELEKCSTYVGLKLLWATKLFLLGQKFPKNMFKRIEWRLLVHDIADAMTKSDCIETMTEISPKIYF
jgi:hypothetical protein